MVAISAPSAMKLATTKKPNRVPKVLCGQRIRFDFVVFSGVVKSSRLRFLRMG